MRSGQLATICAEKAWGNSRLARSRYACAAREKVRCMHVAGGMLHCATAVVCRYNREKKTTTEFYFVQRCALQVAELPCYTVQF